MDLTGMGLDASGVFVCDGELFFCQTCGRGEIVVTLLLLLLLHTPVASSGSSCSDGGR